MSWLDRRAWDTRAYAVLASLLISGWRMLVAGPPNDDAFIYLRTAEIFLQQGAGAALEHYSWAAYPVVIGLLHNLLPLSLLNAALLLNGLFFALLVYSFISIVREFTTDRRILLFAALAVLLYPQLNEYRDLVIRDIGFWALALFGLWQFLRFSATRGILPLLMFCVALIAAAGLRMEALAYLLATPFALLLDRRREWAVRMSLFLLAFGAAVAWVLVVFLVALAAGLDLPALFGQFVSVYLPFLADTFNPDPARAMAMSETIFNEHAARYSAEYLALFMVTGLTAVLIANSLPAISASYLVVLGLAAWKRSFRIDRSLFIPVLIWVLVNGAMVFAFILVTRYMTSRYMMVLGISLALFIPFLLNKLLVQAEQNGRRGPALGLIAFMWLYCFFDAYVSFGQDKAYLEDAAAWIRENSEAGTMLVTNNRAIAYFSGRVEEYDEITDSLGALEIAAAPLGTVIAVEMTFELQRLLESGALDGLLERMVVFPAEEDPEVVIYRRVSGG